MSPVSPAARRSLASPAARDPLGIRGASPARGSLGTGDPPASSAPARPAARDPPAAGSSRTMQGKHTSQPRAYAASTNGRVSTSLRIDANTATVGTALPPVASARDVPSSENHAYHY